MMLFAGCGNDSDLSSEDSAESNTSDDSSIDDASIDDSSIDDSSTDDVNIDDSSIDDVNIDDVNIDDSSIDDVNIDDSIIDFSNYIPPNSEDYPLPEYTNGLLYTNEKLYADYLNEPFDGETMGDYEYHLLSEYEMRGKPSYYKIEILEVLSTSEAEAFDFYYDNLDYSTSCTFYKAKVITDYIRNEKENVEFYFSMRGDNHSQLYGSPAYNVGDLTYLNKKSPTSEVGDELCSAPLDKYAMRGNKTKAEYYPCTVQKRI